MKELQIIKELMEQLQDEMSYSKDDFEERLGRKKPEGEVVKIEGKLEEDPELENMEEELGMDLDQDDEMGESPEHIEAVEEGPEESLKKRLLRLRGE